MKNLALLVAAFGVSLSVNAQVCGYSVTTIYLSDSGAKPIEGAKVEIFDKDSESIGHFKVYTRTYWDKERKAYVIRHGLCGEHRNVVLRISAEAFEIAEQVVDLPFGRQGFIFRPKRKGTEEKFTVEKLSCEKQSPLCAGISEENDGGTR